MDKGKNLLYEYIIEMSCTSATAPMDIGLTAITGKCDLKCSYQFHYSNSSCVATNRGDYLSLSYDQTTSPPVLYNATNYHVQEIRIYTPSLHSYNGTRTDAELVVLHQSILGGSPLLVGVPIQRGMDSSSSVSSVLFQTIVGTVASSAPAEGETTTISQSINLDTLIPKKPFFSYSATEPFQPCSGNMDYVVFSPLEGSLEMTPDTLATLQRIIQSHPYDVKPSGTVGLFYNETGSSSIGEGGDNGGIYIDCQPVGNSQETTDVVYDTGLNNSSSSGTDWLHQPLVQLLLGTLLFILILMGLKLGINFISSSSS